MILFYPFRTLSDLQQNGSYQKKLNQLLQENFIDDDMIQIAENIQLLYNSMDSTLPKDSLAACTDIETEINNYDTDEEIIEDHTSQLLEDMIAKVIVPSSTNENSNQYDESNIINMSFTNNESTIFNNDASSKPVMNNVLHYDTTNDEEDKKNKGIEDNKFDNEKYLLKCSTLNSLLLKKIRQNNDINQNQEYSSMQNSANGTCKSIKQWGRENGLDKEQQMAFELIVGTYILSFFEHLHYDIVDMTNLLEEEKNLKSMVRYKIDLGPMRLFITGPAGSGKCKLIIILSFHENYNTTNIFPL